MSSVIVYVNTSPFSAILFVVILSAVNAFVPATVAFVGVTVHVLATIHGFVGSVGSVGTTGVLPSVVITFTTLLPNALYSAISDVTCNLYVTVTVVPLATLSSV